MNAYEQKQEERRERLRDAADRQDEEATRRFQRAHDATAGIPFGQPILVGHHSEGRHRAALRRSDTNMRKGSEAYTLAQELRYKAAAVGTGGISADDPEAVEKLQSELRDAEHLQEQGKRLNAAYRKRDLVALAELGYEGDTLAALDRRIAEAYSWEKAPVVGWELKNRNANIRRIRQRIAELEQLASAPLPADVVIGDITIIEDATENRVMLRFPRELEHVRAAIKSRGWKWSPTRTAWVRQRGAGVMRLAVQLVRDALCNGTEDEHGPACMGLDVRRAKATPPGHDDEAPFDARWCAGCRAEALGQGYTIL